jgi:hypothetical protein
MQSTPAFTQKEHHSSSMDSYFSVPSAEKKENNPKAEIQESKANDNDWLNNFGAALNDKVSADDILYSLSDKLKHK